MTDDERFAALAAQRRIHDPYTCDLHGACPRCQQYWRIVLTNTPSGGSY